MLKGFLFFTGKEGFLLNLSKVLGYKKVAQNINEVNIFYFTKISLIIVEIFIIY